ncbi:MAG: hypothetical protein HZC17_10040 [Candidatus Omnitrophica bacterium]|nr:hypothetical protein [Candidatus Omnitrophota bacterium]
MKRFPNQIIRLIIPFVIIIAGLLIAKKFLVPASFGKLGHFRADALGEAMSKPIHYVGQQACADCHDEIVKKKAASYHKGVACEVCHGPGSAHVDSPTENKPPAPRDRGFCPVCHSYNPSRPTGFPQIVTVTHNPGKACISCHNAHDPVPPHAPEQCGACHGDIARTKMASPHVDVPCTVCHETPTEHRMNPRMYVPTIPANREFCGKCHAKDAQSAKEIPRIDMGTHGERYVCWECHYPHLPQVYNGAAK